MSEPLRQIVTTALSREAWEPFGWIPVADTDPGDGLHRLDYEWQDVHLNLISHRRDEVPANAGGLRCEEMYRHLTHTQGLMPLDARAVVVVAPAALTISSGSETSQCRAFLVEPLQSFVLHRGTWHWGPFPIGAASVQLLNIQGRGYAEDNDRLDLEAVGASLDVQLPT